jgi:prepilin-type N-terminal cleavage/methylation domain-containing protein
MRQRPPRRARHAFVTLWHPCVTRGGEPSRNGLDARRFPALRTAAPPLLYEPMLPGPRSNRATRGRSLIEVLTAISLSAILMAIAVPNFSGLRSPYLLRQTSQQIAAEFSKARMRAIARNARYRLTYNSTSKTYQLEREITSGSNTWTAESVNSVSGLVSLSGVGTPPIFDTRGMLNSDVSIGVSVQGYSKTRTVTINVLGQVTIS